MSQVLSLYASGKTTAILVDMGASNTSSMPIYEGTPIMPAFSNIPLGGLDLTRYLEDKYTISYK